MSAEAGAAVEMVAKYEYLAALNEVQEKDREIRALAVQKANVQVEAAQLRRELKKIQEEQVVLRLAVIGAQQVLGDIKRRLATAMWGDRLTVPQRKQLQGMIAELQHYEGVQLHRLTDLKATVAFALKLHRRLKVKLKEADDGDV